ncbi:MAG: rod shape-determining protein MreD [Firmicutes bacterium]|nr:rod shape-determining protein MreD [Bacillota bacterium]
MRILVITVLVIINFVLQSTLFPHIAIMGVTPDTALILIVSYAILRGDIEGALFGMFTGFVQDLSGGLFVGLFALLGFITGYICGKPFKDFFKDNYFLPFAILVIISLVYQFVLYITTIMFTGQMEFLLYARTIILPKTIYTASLSIPLYSLLHYINARLERHEEKFSGIFKKSDGDEK